MNYSLAKLFRSKIESKIHAREPAPVLKSESFSWRTQVEALYPEIRRELEIVLQRTQDIVNFDQVLPDQRALKQGGSWKSFFLIALGKPVAKHQKICPATTQALTHIPGVMNAFFSILAPGTHIPAHRGPYAGILRYHLGLIIPSGDLGIRVGNETCRWEEGKSLFFDDSFEHEAWNQTDSVRVILFVDFERPLPPILTMLNRVVLTFFENSEAAQMAQTKVMKTQVTR